MFNNTSNYASYFDYLQQKKTWKKVSQATALITYCKL